MAEHLLVLGGTSDIGISIARRFEEAGYSITLAGRNVDRMKAQSAEAGLKPGVECISFDATDFKSHAAFYSQLKTKPDIVVSVFGLLGKQDVAQSSWSDAEAIIQTNYTGAVSILGIVANDFEKRKSGIIVGVSSVGGERGRASNYIYGSAKAGVTAFLSGLRNRLAASNVHVLTVLPGFVRTKMISGTATPGFLTATPAGAAKRIFSATIRRKNVVYVGPLWYWVMLVIRNLPEFVFKRMKL